MIKQWWLVLVIAILGIILLATGLVGIFTEAFQLAVKKVFLVSIWYGLTYLIRIYRLGHIDWQDEKMKIYYYFMLLLGSAIIIAWS